MEYNNNDYDIKIDTLTKCVPCQQDPLFDPCVLQLVLNYNFFQDPNQGFFVACKEDNLSWAMWFVTKGATDYWSYPYYVMEHSKEKIGSTLFQLCERLRTCQTRARLARCKYET